MQGWGVFQTKHCSLGSTLNKELWEQTKPIRDKVLTLHKMQGRKPQNKSLTLPNPANFMFR